jgi:hypothetical protein
MCDLEDRSHKFCSYQNPFLCMAASSIQTLIVEALGVSIDKHPGGTDFEGTATVDLS